MTDNSEWIRFRAPGGEFRAFTVKPEGPPPWPTLIAIHAASGLDPHHENLTRDFAAQGYFTVSPDIYSNDANYRTFLLADVEDGMVIGPRIKDIDAYLAQFPKSRHESILRARDWIDARPGDTYIDTIRACYEMLRPRQDVAAIGVIGFCMGGRLVAELAATGADLAAGVIYYGIDPKRELIGNIRCPLLGHYGVIDKRITDRVPDFAAAMKAAGKDFTYHVYEAGHGFANAVYLKAHNVEATRRAGERTKAFLAAHLKAPVPSRAG